MCNIPKSSSQANIFFPQLGIVQDVRYDNCGERVHSLIVTNAEVALKSIFPENGNSGLVVCSTPTLLIIEMAVSLPR